MSLTRSTSHGQPVPLPQGQVTEELGQGKGLGYYSVFSFTHYHTGHPGLIAAAPHLQAHSRVRDFGFLPPQVMLFPWELHNLPLLLTQVFVQMCPCDQDLPDRFL